MAEEKSDIVGSINYHDYDVPDTEALTVGRLKRRHPVAHHALEQHREALDDFKRFMAAERQTHDLFKQQQSAALEKRQVDYERMCRESAAYEDQAKALGRKLDGEVRKQQLFLARIGKLIEGQVDLLPMDLEDNDKPLGPPTTFELDAGEVREVLKMYWDLVADQMEQKIGSKHTFELENGDFELQESDVQPFTKSMVNEAFQMIDAQQRSSAVSAMKAEARKAAERRRMARMIQS